MVFSSIEFIIFFLIVVLVLYFNPFFKSRKFKNIILFLSSLVFYAWGEPIYIFLLLLSILINFFLGLAIDKKKGKMRKILLILDLIYNIGILFIFKYLVFTLSNIAFLFNKECHLEIALPIGISFFTFQIISYIIDVYKEKLPVQKNIIHLGLYISMFPQLVAGPIVRYETVADEIVNRKETWDQFTKGLYRFIYGLAKKVLIANNIALLADSAFSSTELSVASSWLGAIAYTLQIYFDFSGYSDMAIGLGLMFGFHFNENFNYPYIAKSVTDFWRRWHISLSTWFRDYIYIPLGGNRVKKSRWILNLLAVWLLTGIWHGANWTFILWGLFYFSILITEKLTNFPQKLGFLSHIYTMVIVILAWVMFRANDIASGFRYIGYMFGIHSSGIFDSTALTYLSQFKIYLIIGIIASLPIKKYFDDKISKKQSSIYYYFEGIYISTIFIICIANLLASSYNPFIYYNF